MNKNRLINEMSQLCKNFNDIRIYKENNNDIMIIKEDNEYKFILDQNYPFRSPKYFFVNNINYKKKLCFINSKLLVYLKKIYGIDCLCCNSLFCNNNWSPGNRLEQIINEYNDNVLIKKNIVKHYLCDLIKKKYNCDFAYFELYL
jgi:hypothetical protein